jgi:hypothetical protein
MGAVSTANLGKRRLEEGRMSNAATDSNINPIGLPERSNVTVSSVSLNFFGTQSNQVLLIGQFSVDTENAAGGGVVATILVNGRTATNTQVNNLQGNTGTLLSLSGVVTVGPGKGTFDLQASVFNMPSASVHHRTITAVSLD